MSVGARVCAGQPCCFLTMSVLWSQKSFSAVHWASESPSRCLVGTPSLRTQQTLFQSALNRTVRCDQDEPVARPCTAAPQTETETQHPSETQHLRETTASVAAAAAAVPESASSQPSTSHQQAHTCDLTCKPSHPLIPRIRRRRWQERAAENRRKRAAQQQERRVQGT